MSDTPVGPGSWQASDGKWYRAEQAPNVQQPPPGWMQQGPQGAASMGVPGPLASWGERAVAYLIDAAILFVGFIAVAIVAAVLGVAVDFIGALVGMVGYLAIFGAGLYFMYMQGVTGASPGKKLTGLRVVGVQTGQPIGGGLGIVRYFAHIVDAMICYLGFLLPLFDEKRQTIGDKIIGTVVTTNAPKQSFGPELFTI